MRQGWLPARLLVAACAATLLAGAAQAQSVQDFERAMSGAWTVAPGPASGGKACRLDLDPAAAPDGHAVKSDDCGGALGGAVRWAIVAGHLNLYNAGKATIVALGGNQTRLTGKSTQNEAIELVRPAAATAAPARPTAAQLVAAFAGEWRVQPAKGAARAAGCRLDLKVDAGRQRLFVSNAGCTGALASVTAWAIADNKLALRDTKGQNVVMLGGNQLHMTGRTKDGHDVALARVPPPPARHVAAGRGCAYLGYSATCAGAADLKPPTIPANGSAPLGVLVELNLRGQPSMSAPVVGVVPAKTCVAADTCQQNASGLWCHARTPHGSGWIKKEAVRQNRWLVVAFRNHC